MSAAPPLPPDPAGQSEAPLLVETQDGAEHELSNGSGRENETALAAQGQPPPPEISKEEEDRMMKVRLLLLALNTILSIIMALSLSKELHLKRALVCRLLCIQSIPQPGRATEAYKMQKQSNEHEHTNLMQEQGQDLDHDFPVILPLLVGITHIHLHAQEFLADLKSTDRDSEVNRILSAFKLNPFHILGLKLDADRSSIRQAYRKASLMVHPDKCTHPKATTAFDKLGQAQKDLESDDQWNELQYVFGIAKGRKTDSVLHASLYTFRRCFDLWS